MNELFTDFKKQFEKLSNNQTSSSQPYQVSITYEKYFIRKKEVCPGVLMIVIFNMEQDGHATGDEQDTVVTTSSFNMGQVDTLFADFEGDFSKVQGEVEEITKLIQ